MNKIGVGIIGASPGHTSWAAATHIPALRALPGYELRAVATSRRESAERAAAAYRVRAYHSGSELVADPDVDLVVVAVKVPRHAELVSQALAAGKMVYSEWPLGVDLAEARELVDQADAAGVRTVIGLQGRYAPEIRHAHELIANEKLGTILATTLIGSGAAWGPVTDRSHAYLYDLANGATTLTAAAMHALDALAYVLGEPASVSATMAVRQQDVRLAEDGAHVTVTAPDQVSVHGVLAGGAVITSPVSTPPSPTTYGPAPRRSPTSATPFAGTNSSMRFRRPIEQGALRQRPETIIAEYDDTRPRGGPVSSASTRPAKWAGPTPLRALRGASCA
jgi:predicted dehydrogenase